MSLPERNFKTPLRAQQWSRTCSSASTPSSTSAERLTIPASPAMKKLGFGTGVSVFLMERFSPGRGHYGSPWAIKKINSSLKRSAAAMLQNSEGGTSNKKQKTSDGFVIRRVSVEEMCNSRLEAEAKLLRSLKHPNIIGFRGYTTAVDGTKCLIMESGERDLYDILEQRADKGQGPLPARHIHKVSCDMSSGLHYLHNSERLLHGDLKSANVLVKGEFNQIKLCDFGVCIKLDQKMEAAPDQFYVGTECWSPPEVINEDAPVTDRADVFAFGLTIWECVALMPPHVHLLTSEPDEEQLSLEQQDLLCEQREENFRLHLGTRPSLPPIAGSLTGLYLPLLEMFYHCTSAKPQDRPSAADLVLLCNNMTPDTSTTAAAGDATTLVTASAVRDTMILDTADEGSQSHSNESVSSDAGTVKSTRENSSSGIGSNTSGNEDSSDVTSPSDEESDGMSTRSKVRHVPVVDLTEDGNCSFVNHVLERSTSCNFDTTVDLDDSTATNETSYNSSVRDPVQMGPLKLFNKLTPEKKVLTKLSASKDCIVEESGVESEKLSENIAA